MAASSGVYLADDLNAPGIGSPQGDLVKRKFTVTLATALAQTGATKFLLGDVILLAPLPSQCNFVNYRIYCPNMDTGSGATLDIGDTQVLSGAVTGQVNTGGVALPAVGSTFTLTATASTSSFTGTNGLLMVGNGLIVNYESLSGSTFVNCRCAVGSGVVPGGVAIQQLGNTAAYQAASAAGCANLAGVMTPDFSQSAANAIVTSTPVQNGVPTVLPKAFKTGTQATIGGPTFGNIEPFYFLMRFHAAITTIGTTTNKITGWVEYYQQGF